MNPRSTRDAADEVAGIPGDLRLPAWGPYTKAYAGISHLPDLKRGLRFDLSVFPGLYRRRQILPNVNMDSGCLAWRASPGLDRYTFRHMLEGIDSLFADITYSVHPGGRLIHTEFVNRTSRPQQVCLHYLASINFPEAGPGHRPPLRPAEVILPPGAAWVDGRNYARLVLHEDSPQRHLPDDAEIWGEARGDGFVDGTGLGRGFGIKPGHKAVYAVPPGFDRAGAIALLRYRLARGQSTTLRVTGAYAGTLELQGSEDFQLAAVPPGSDGAAAFELEPDGRAELEIDGFALTPRGRVAEVRFHIPPLDYRPRLHSETLPRTLMLEYPAIPGAYGLTWEAEHHETREWLSDRLDHDFPFFTHHHARRVLDCGGERHFTDVFVRPVFLAPGETRELRGYVCHEVSPEKTAANLGAYQANPVAVPVTSAASLPAYTESGRDYACGVERLSAVLATNVVYPVRRFGHHIRHYTPGRWWDSLYTWDSGFIGLGLLELDPARSADNLAAYLTDPGQDAAFVHHGSPVPAQIYQLHELWNRTQNRALLARFFPGARRMHRFLVGRGDGSRTATLASGLLHTWDYFYNSGGWDDYPPQKHIRGTPLTASIAPVINSAQAVRTAKLLRDLAGILDEPAGEFDSDIHHLTEALQRHSWNPRSGWFSYVRHDHDGQPVGPLLHESGEDFNRGLDGIYPLVAGICTPAQETLFLQRLRDENIFWTKCGLSTVDQSAPYYRTDGYWNGAVWMPHQWFFWKTLLDLGEGALAWQIARTALDTWEAEVRASGCCFEHFIIRTGRGAGWHQFGGLSSPILNWFSAYFSPGRLTGGYGMLTLEQTFDGHALRARLRMSGPRDRSPVVLAVAPKAAGATWNDIPVPAATVRPGTLEIRLPAGASEGELRVA